MTDVKVKPLIETMSRKGISVESAARQMGISWRTLYRWIREDKKPSNMALIIIEKFIRENE